MFRPWIPKCTKHPIPPLGSNNSIMPSQVDWVVVPAATRVMLFFDTGANRFLLCLWRISVTTGFFSLLDALVDSFRVGGCSGNGMPTVTPRQGPTKPAKSHQLRNVTNRVAVCTSLQSSTTHESRQDSPRKTVKSLGVSANRSFHRRRSATGLSISM